MPNTPGVRRSLLELQAEYDAGDKEALETLMRAWKGVKERPLDADDSFFSIGGFHGEPFRDEGVTDPAWWGGYCEHGTVLFPTWHRAYLHVLERALQSVPGCADVMLPFWDETSAESLAGGLPAALTWETFELDGETIPNPLRSFVLPTDIVDSVTGDDGLYSKPAGYETVRYPLSGLVGTAKDQAATAAHNAQFPDYDANVATLNGNITTWLKTAPSTGGGFVQQKFVHCLDAPSYTLFSNTTSASAFNADDPSQHVVPLESPHNSIHLAVGGFDVPGQGDASPIPGANGDMGENDTAALDPVFYFHHCFIDYVFAIWQQRHDSTTSLEINSEDAGAGYSANNPNPPPAGRHPDEQLDVNTPLNPFTTADGAPMTSAGVADLSKLGYRYGPGSLDAYAAPAAPATVAALAAPLAAEPEPSGRSVHVSGISRGKLRGSFVISAFAEVDGKLEAIGHEAVLSRWQLEGCSNCQSRLNVKTAFPLPAGARAATERTTDGVQVRLTTRHDLLAAADRTFAVDAAPSEDELTVEIR